MHGVAVPQTLASTWPQVCPLGQLVPQLSEPPQPSPIVPQYWTPFEAVQLPGVQLGSPHRYEVPRPPQVAGVLQPGQVMVPPQPSPIVLQ